MSAPELIVIPAQAGIKFVGMSALKPNQMNHLDSGLRRNDGSIDRRAGLCQGFL